MQQVFGNYCISLIIVVMSFCIHISVAQCFTFSRFVIVLSFRFNALVALLVFFSLRLQLFFFLALFLCTHNEYLWKIYGFHSKWFSVKIPCQNSILFTSIWSIPLQLNWKILVCIFAPTSSSDQKPIEDRPPHSDSSRGLLLFI